MKQILLILVLSLFCTLASAMDYVPSQANQGAAITIDNRILLKVHNKAITTMDIVRKMDVLFYRQYPEMASSDAMRYQFYTASWQPILQMVLDEELILADAEEKQIPITDGEVRQEMEQLFGPNVVITLNKINLTFEEAFDLIKRELLVQKATSAFVRSKALAEVTPAAIKQAYRTLLAASTPEDRYHYRIITLSAGEHALCQKEAEELYEEITKGEKSVEELLAEKREHCVITLSEQYVRAESEMALPHLKALRELAKHQVSKPDILQTKKERPSFRLFLLDEYVKGVHPPLAEIEGQLKQQLLQDAYATHNEAYRNKLRHYYDITDNYLASFTPKEFKPFAMR